MWCTGVFLGPWLLLPCVVIVSLNKRSCSNNNWPTLCSTQELLSQLRTQYPIFHENPSLGFSYSPETPGGRGRDGEKECFVSHNYSPIIWSKYDITGHFVVQAAWLWSSCGRMCFALEAPLWSMFPVTKRITVRSPEQAPPVPNRPHPRPRSNSTHPWSILGSSLTNKVENETSREEKMPWLTQMV